MNVQDWPIEKVIPYPDNPRSISDSAVDAVAESIKRYGWQQPIVVDGEGVVVVGHTRLRAAQKIGLDAVPVLVADLTSEEARSYRIADNKTGEFCRMGL